MVKLQHQKLTIFFFSENKQALGVVLKLAEVCVRLNHCQKQFMKAIKEKVIPETQNPILFLLRLAHIRGRGPPGFSFLGSMLLQTLMQFDVSLNKFLFEGFQTLEIKQLLSIANDSIGGHSLGYYLQHEHLKSSEKQKFIDRFAGNFGKVWFFVMNFFNSL